MNMFRSNIKYDKILIIQYNLIGDVILSTGVVKAVRDQFPDSKLAFLVSPDTADLVRLPFIDELVVYTKGMPLLPVIRQVWRYDVALLLDFKYRSAVIPFLARIPVRAGLAHKRKLFMTHAIPLPDYNYKCYITEYMAKILEDAIGLHLVHDVTRLYVADATEQDKKAVSAYMGPNKDDMLQIVIAPFTSSRMKEWPIEYWRAFMEELSRRISCRFIVFGSKADADKEFYVPDGALDLRGVSTMTESAEVLRRADYFIGGCSAPLHLASAVRTPSLALYGPTSTTKWLPRHDCICLQHIMPCNPCDRQYGATCGQAGTCMKAITVEECLEGFQRLMEQYPKKRT